MNQTKEEWGKTKEAKLVYEWLKTKAGGLAVHPIGDLGFFENLFKSATKEAEQKGFNTGYKVGTGDTEAVCEIEQRVAKEITDTVWQDIHDVTRADQNFTGWFFRFLEKLEEIKHQYNITE